MKNKGFKTGDRITLIVIDTQAGIDTDLKKGDTGTVSEYESLFHTVYIKFDRKIKVEKDTLVLGEDGSIPMPDKFVELLR